jgi:hypothetical protein
MWNISFTSKKDNSENKEAETILKRAGFELRDRQVKRTVITTVNGQDRVGYVIADYLVRKEKKNFAVVLHSTAEELEPNEANTRRRLIELERAFPSAKMLVLDMKNGSLNTVSFRFPREWGIDGLFNLLIALFIVAAIIGIIWMLATLRLI